MRQLPNMTTMSKATPVGSRQAVADKQSRVKLGPQSLHVTPDKGWAWLILGASFICQALAGGVVYSFGVLLLELLDYFGENRALTAWVGSAISGMCPLIGTVGSLMTTRFGCKVTTIVGGLLGCVGFLLSTFSPNIYFMILTYSVLGGSGIGLVYVTSFIIVTQVFVKYRSVATGIVASGVGVGTFAFTPFYAFLNQIYSWKGTMWIMAGVVLHCCVMAFFYRDPPPAEYRNDDSSSKMKVLMHPACIVIGLTGLFGCLGYFIPFIFITDLVESLGFDRSQGAVLLSIVGISNMVGRAVSGVIINCSWTSTSTLHMVGFLIGGLPTLTVPWMTLFPLLCGYSVCIGLGFGASVTLSTILLQEYLGAENIPVSVGSLSLFRGVSSMISGPLAGLLYKWTGGHTWMFVIAGALITLAAVATLPLCWMKSWDSRHVTDDLKLHPKTLKSFDVKMASQLSLTTIS